MMTIKEAAQQLERSERGQITCKLLKDFLGSNAVKYLDDQNSAACALLVMNYMVGGGNKSSAVMTELEAVIERNRWVVAK